MTLADGALVGVAALCYAITAVLRIALPTGRRVIPVAAFGPALIALGPAGYDVASWEVVLGAGLGAELVAALIAQRRPGLFFWHALLLVWCGVLFMALAGIWGPGLADAPIRMLTVATLAALVYPAGDLGARTWTRERPVRGRFREEAKVSLPVYGVLVSTSGLAVLAVPPLGWVAFLLLLGPVLVTKHEFQRFEEMRRTYDQTVAALSRLLGGVDSPS